MASVFDLLEAIEKRPMLYVGGDGSNRGAMLQRIELLLHGYALAIQQHRLDEPVKDFPREFAEYLRTQYDWSAAAGPVAAICDAAKDDREAWEMFWRLVREFRAKLGQ
jgi:hypothetical protein